MKLFSPFLSALILQGVYWAGLAQKVIWRNVCLPISTKASGCCLLCPATITTTTWFSSNQVHGLPVSLDPTPYRCPMLAGFLCLCQPLCLALVSYCGLANSDSGILMGKAVGNNCIFKWIFSSFSGHFLPSLNILNCDRHVSKCIVIDGHFKTCCVKVKLLLIALSWLMTVVYPQRMGLAALLCMFWFNYGRSDEWRGKAGTYFFFLFYLT